MKKSEVEWVGLNCWGWARTQEGRFLTCGCWSSMRRPQVAVAVLPPSDLHRSFPPEQLHPCTADNSYTPSSPPCPPLLPSPSLHSHPPPSSAPLSPTHHNTAQPTPLWPPSDHTAPTSSHTSPDSPSHLPFPTPSHTSKHLHNPLDPQSGSSNTLHEHDIFLLTKQHDRNNQLDDKLEWPCRGRKEVHRYSDDHLWRRESRWYQRRRSG